MKTLLIGYGNLGKIYAGALLQQKIVEQNDLFILCKTTQQQKMVEENGHGLPVLANDHPNIHPDVVLLVVKPQDAHSIYAPAKDYLHENTLVISVMAGISMATLTQELHHQKIVRAMPNSPIAIGMGMTGYTVSGALTTHERKRAEYILASTGRTMYFEEEQLLDAVTALSGSGPAYFFYLLQNMIAAGQQMGFSEEVATALVKQTMLGSFHLFDRSGKTASTLISEVASKGGTTQAAFRIFDQYKMGEAITEGLKQACKRAGELNSQTDQVTTPLL